MTGPKILRKPNILALIKCGKFIVNRATGKPLKLTDNCLTKETTIGGDPMACAEAVKAVKEILKSHFQSSVQYDDFVISIILQIKTACQRYGHTWFSNKSNDVRLSQDSYPTNPILTFFKIGDKNSPIDDSTKHGYFLILARFQCFGRCSHVRQIRQLSSIGRIAGLF